MDTNKSKPNFNSKHAQVGAAATDLLDESKKLAHELYDDGLKKIGATQKDVQAYSDEILAKVRENPLKSVLIAGGIGFVIAALLKK